MNKQAVKAAYRPLPEISPYTSHERYFRTKETHKYYLKKFNEFLLVKNKLNVLDVGCGNGELLHVIKNSFPHWSLKGIDPTKEFIECAKAFDGLKNVEFEVNDINNFTQESMTYDLVLCTSVLQIFTDIIKPLEQLIKTTKRGGIFFVMDYLTNMTLKLDCSIVITQMNMPKDYGVLIGTNIPKKL